MRHKYAGTHFTDTEEEEIPVGKGHQIDSAMVCTVRWPLIVPDSYERGPIGMS
jgi:hypothetical protein